MQNHSDYERELLLRRQNVLDPQHVVAILPSVDHECSENVVVIQDEINKFVIY